MELLNDEELGEGSLVVVDQLGEARKKAFIRDVSQNALPTRYCRASIG